ncbi:MAG: benzoate-CoA ligase family protein [Alphaproteobacteria bacterium]|nr:benzoate-CoA ligase family protein [Alphaproteobacteria bacterium]
MNAADEVLGPPLARGYGSAIALRWRDQEISYKALAEQVNRAGHALRGLGVRPGDRVAIQLTDTPEFVACYLGAMKVGAVSVALNLRLGADEIAYILNDCEAKVLLIDRQFRATYDGVADRIGHEMAVIEADVNGDGASELAALLSRQSGRLKSVECPPEDMAFWIYTSGTTGGPKAAVHAHRDVCVAELYAGETLGVRYREVLFATSKLFFAYTLGTCLFGALRLGATTVLYEGWPDAQGIAQVINRYRPTIVFSVPTMYRNMLADGVTDGPGFSDVRHYVSAGERLPASLWQRWRDATGVEILDGMGTSETIYMLLTNSPGAVKPGTSGMAAPGADVRLADADGADVSPGEPGILWARIPSCCNRYWGRQEESADVFRGGWFRTGDMYIVDEDGYWHHQGRHDDMLKISGQWVSPGEIEEVVLAETDARDAVVVATEDQDELVRTTLFVVPSARDFDSAALEAEIRETLLGKLAPYKCPKWIRFVDAIPRTATGKAQRYKLRLGDGEQEA